jgi:hypothetical protein
MEMSMRNHYWKRGRGALLPSILAVLGGLFVVTAAQAACSAGAPNASAPVATPTEDFTDNADGTVTHNLTGLMWKKCSEGVSGDSCSSGTVTTMVWTDALQAAVTDVTAGYSDWRLPNQRELLSIAEICGSGPALNKDIFPNTPSGYYWSATTYLTNRTYAWTVSSGNGSTFANSKTNTGYTRLVRGGQSPTAFDTLAPQLSAVSVANTGAHGTTLTATSSIDATGYWLVVAQGSVVPTATEVKAGANYGAVTLAAVGTGSMGAGAVATFSVGGLAEATTYDIYLVGYDDNNKALTYAPGAAAFTTLDGPDAFTFTDQGGVALSSVVTSNTITVGGLGTTATIAVSGGEYQIGEGVYTAENGTVSNGDTVTLRATSSSSGLTAVDVVLDINGVSDTFTITTELDTDGDGAGNTLDTDDDGDGVADTDDAFPLDASETLDTDGDGIGNNTDTDDDGDGVADSEDDFPLDASQSVAATSGGGGGGGAMVWFPLVALPLLWRRRKGGAPCAG